MAPPLWAGCGSSKSFHYMNLYVYSINMHNYTVQKQLLKVLIYYYNELRLKSNYMKFV